MEYHYNDALCKPVGYNYSFRDSNGNFAIVHTTYSRCLWSINKNSILDIWSERLGKHRSTDKYQRLECLFKCIKIICIHHRMKVIEHIDLRLRCWLFDEVKHQVTHLHMSLTFSEYEFKGKVTLARLKVKSKLLIPTALYQCTCPV